MFLLWSLMTELFSTRALQSFSILLTWYGDLWNQFVMIFILCQQAPGKIAPVNGTVARSVLQNVLSYVSTEVHPNIGGLFNPSATEDVKTYIRGNAAKKLTYLNDTLIGTKQFVVGDSFTVADSYLYIVLSWTAYVGIDLTPYPNVKKYFEFIGSQENVKAAHARMATSPATTF